MRRLINRVVAMGCVVTGMMMLATASGVANGAAGGAVAGDITGLGAIRVADENCTWRVVETIRACAAPAEVCPNGFCQSYQECSQSEFRFACPPLPSSILYPGGMMCRVELDCGTMLPMRHKVSCRCSKGLVGCCLNDCTPSGSSNGEIACIGQIVTVMAPQE